MKILFTILCCGLLCTGLMAQSSDEIAVSDAVSRLHKAITDADSNSLEALTDKDLSYGHSSGKIENKTAFMEAILSGNVDFSSIDLTNQTISISGKNAMVRNTFAGTLSSNGKPMEIKINVLMVWRKQHGHWVLLARQGYKI